MRYALPLVLALLLAGCTHTASTSRHMDHSPDARADIEAVNGELEAAIAAGDGAAVGRLYTSDAIYMPPNRPAIVGSEAIGADWQAGIDSGITRAELVTEEVMSHGHMAHERGVYRVYGGDRLLDTGKYIVIWRHEEGRWKLHRDIFNSDG